MAVLEFLARTTGARVIAARISPCRLIVFVKALGSRTGGGLRRDAWQINRRFQQSVARFSGPLRLELRSPAAQREGGGQRPQRGEGGQGGDTNCQAK